MSLLGVGPLEMLVIFMVALLVVGPEKLPELGTFIGRIIVEVRSLTDELRHAMNEALTEQPAPSNAAGADAIPTSSGTASATPAAREERQDSPFASLSSTEKPEPSAVSEEYTVSVG